VEIKDVKTVILRTLIQKRKVGGAHTPLDNITHNLPDDLLHDKKGQKIIDEAVKELVNSNFVIVLKKKTGKGSDLHISLNPRAIKEISEFLGISTNN